MLRLSSLLVALAGLSAGWGAVLTWERVRLDAGPPGWTHWSPDVPLRLAQLTGAPHFPGQGYPLGAYEVLLAAEPDQHGISATADIPEGGVLELRLGGERWGEGAVLYLSRIGDGYAGVYSADGEEQPSDRMGRVREPLDCDGSLTAPGDGLVTASLIVTAPGTVTASLDDEQVHCAVTGLTGQAALRSGLRDVGLLHAETPDGAIIDAPGPLWAGRALAGLLGALLGVLALAWGRRRNWRDAVVVAPLLPLLMVWPLAELDLTAIVQSARVVARHYLLWAPGLPLTLSFIVGAGVWLGRWWARAGEDAPWEHALVAGTVAGATGMAATGAWLSVPVGAAAGGALWGLLRLLDPGARPGRGTVGALAVGALVTLAGRLGQPEHAVAAVWGGGMAALVVVVLWANLRQVRAFNLVSLAGVLAALFLANGALDRTATGSSLMGRSSRSRYQGDVDRESVYAGFEAIDVTHEYSDYPDSGYPTAPEPREAPVRIVAFGGSTTGGAYQNDDLSVFWPAKLEERLAPGVQVVNQGVGGWTTLHIRRYVETQHERLDMDIGVLYVGNNDVVTEGPQRFSELYREWSGGDSLTVRTSALLGRSVLYQALRFSLQALVRPEYDASIPISDSRANLQAIIDVLRGDGARTLLVREGISPDPGMLQDFGQMEHDLAAQAPDVAYLDAAGRLADPAVGAVFIDACHLTSSGHELLSGWVADKLRDLGWLDGQR